MRVGIGGIAWTFPGTFAGNGAIPSDVRGDSSAFAVAGDAGTCRAARCFKPQFGQNWASSETFALHLGQ
ncbi:MAG: hypothetical protein ABI396_03670 [Ktedonobacteraceae bacterium]